MVQFTTIVAMVGMPLLVMASPLAETPTDTTTTDASSLMPSDIPRPTSGPLYNPLVGGGGPGIVNSGNNAWFAGGFRSAVVSAGVKTGEIGDDGKGVVNNQLFNDTGSSDDKLVAAGEWGFKYLTGVDAEKEDVAKDGKNWDDWMDKAYENPVIILTNDKTTAKGLEPKQYYTVYLTKNEDKTISVWHTTTDPNDLLNLFIKVDSKELKENTRYLYHLKGWAKY
ncbi:uncharacterized protein L203_104197 [Cryptococcus depauperatus CBS 7841]|uniref:Uncharacterized protein n=1 Tax=Cryptococcus depauperatus CBS 7841 TaxID=1295531 RepID=A0AAJ8M2R6_9TREE